MQYRGTPFWAGRNPTTMESRFEALFAQPARFTGRREPCLQGGRTPGVERGCSGGEGLDAGAGELKPRWATRDP